MPESEKVLERRLASEIMKQGGLCLKLFPIHITGLPDRLCLLPGGRLFFAEIKTTGERPTLRQRYVHKQLRDLGFRVEIIDTTEGVLQVIRGHEL